MTRSTSPSGRSGMTLALVGRIKELTATDAEYAV